jgi:hypothetical protein
MWRDFNVLTEALGIARNSGIQYRYETMPIVRKPKEGKLL